MSKTAKREEKYRLLIENKFGNVFNYIASEAVRDRHDNWHYYITVECKICGEHKTSTYRTFNASDAVKCICQDEKAVKKSAEKYAVELYSTISSDSKELGYIPPEELREYVRACAAYDRPHMIKSVKYVDMVLENILKLYKKDKVNPCECCGLLYREGSMYHYKKTICKSCHKEKQAEKKKIRQSKELRKNRGLRA